MYTLVCNFRTRDAVLAEAPSLVLALFNAQMFYKFHSSTLENVCFPAT